MTPYYDEGGITIYHGDCREVSPQVEADAVVSDPPYGMAWDGRVTIGRDGQGRTGTRSVSYGMTIVGDSEPFDPRPWLAYPQAILFGANHFPGLPVGTTLVWIKRNDEAFGSFLSDAEIAWMKGGHGIYCFRDTGYKTERTNAGHPSQKPIALMRWCVGKTEGTVLDPFMGSGTTLRAAKDLGRRAIGIEIEERYCEIAANRLGQEVMDFGEAA